MSIIDRITDALDRAEDDHRYPIRLLLGNCEAAELEAALYVPAETIRGLRGEAVAQREEYAPKLPLDGEPVEIFGVPVERVDRETLIEVISEPPDGPVASKRIARHRAVLEYARGLMDWDTWQRVIHDETQG